MIVSFHQDYASYDAFRKHTKRSMSPSINEMNTFLINIEENNTLPPTFSFLARHILKPDNKTKKQSCRSKEIPFPLISKQELCCL